MNKKYLLLSFALIIIVIFVAAELSKKTAQLPKIIVETNSTSTSEIQPIATSTPKVIKSSETKSNLAGVSSVEFKTDIRFSFPEYPGVNFKVVKISRVYDPKADYNFSASGIKDPALLTFDLEITNDSNKVINANYLQVIYNVATESGNQTRIAPYYIHTSYEVAPLSSNKVYPTIIIPLNESEVSMVVGVYPPENYNTAEDLLSKSTDAFLIDFIKKIAWHPEG
jgi:hypothetical protein